MGMRIGRARVRRTCGAGVALAVGVLGAAACEPAPVPYTSLDVASAPTAGVPVDGAVSHLDLSADGSTLAFTAGRSTDVWPTYVRRLGTGDLARVEPVDDAGADVSRGALRLSADGSRAVSVGCRTDPSATDCFVHGLDVATGRWAPHRPLSRHPEATPPIEAADVSADGRRALVRDHTTGLEDLDAGTTARPPAGVTELAHGRALARVTADGRYVSLLVEGPPNGDGTPDVVVWEPATGSLVNVTPFGHAWAAFGMVTADGSTVVFSGAVGEEVGVHAYDVAGGTSELVLAPFDVVELDASADGRRIALTRQEADGRQSVWLLDRDAGTLAQLSVDGANAPADGSSYAPAISADGTTVAFLSEATNLSPDDTTPDADAYVVTVG